MRPITLIMTVVLILPCVFSSLNVCQNCLNSTCGFTCLGQQCQAYSINATCLPGGCINTYFPSYSAQAMNVSSCIACNYTFAGCVLCNTNNCQQCEPEYLLQGGTCYTQGGYPVGYVPPYEQIWIAFVVLFGVFALYFAIMSMLKYRAIQSGRDNLLTTR